MLPDDALDPRIRQYFDDETRAWAKAETGTDPAWAVDYFIRFFMNPLSKWLDLSTCDALECACGNGMNALAFVVAGGKRVRGFDIAESRVSFASELARRSGLSDRAEFVVRGIHDLPDESVDVSLSLQTLEHVPDAVQALDALGRRAKRAVVLSTPNKWFPKDGHDTGLMFAHWLPIEWRRPYAEFRKARTSDFNEFMTPAEIDGTLAQLGFRRTSQAYAFDRLNEWLECYPCYFPYGAGGGRWLGARSHRRRWKMAGRMFDLAGPRAQMLAPMYEGLYLKGR